MSLGLSPQRGGAPVAVLPVLPVLPVLIVWFSCLVSPVARAENAAQGQAAKSVQPVKAESGRGQPPTLERAQQRARTEHKALVIEIGASWCGPCKMLEAEVLPHPAVRKALNEVSFVRYDAEVGPGIAAARALSVIGFPTLVARAQDGSEISRIQGVPTIRQLVRWLQQVAADSESTDVLEVRAKTKPGDSQNLLALSRRYRKQGKDADAQRLAEQALASATGKDETVAANADWSVRLLRLQELMRQEPRKAMVEHLLHYPTGPMADTALQTLSRLGTADQREKEALGRYIDSHKERGQESALNQAVYVCLHVSAFDEAERGARHLLTHDGKNASNLDTLAEVMHLRGDSQAAVKLETEALRSLAEAGPGKGDKGDQGRSDKDDKETQELRQELSSNQARFRRGKREPPASFLQAQESDDPYPWEQF